MALTEEQAALRAANREAQRVLYGQPLGEMCDWLQERLRLSQARLAAVLGVSAPMLSQLKSGERMKSSRPWFVRRLKLLRELAGDATAGMFSREEIAGRLQQITNSGGGSRVPPPRGGSRRSPANGPIERLVREIRAVLQSTAHPADLLDAAHVLAPTHPDLAEFLRLYGAGPTKDAVAHYTTHHRD